MEYIFVSSSNDVYRSEVSVYGVIYRKDMGEE